MTYAFQQQGYADYPSISEIIQNCGGDPSVVDVILILDSVLISFRAKMTLFPVLVPREIANYKHFFKGCIIKSSRSSLHGNSREF